MGDTYYGVDFVECTPKGVCRIMHEGGDEEQLAPIDEVHLEEPKILRAFDSDMSSTEQEVNHFDFDFEPGVVQCTVLKPDADRGPKKMFCNFDR